MTFVHFINVLSGFYSGIADSFSIAIIVSCGQLRLLVCQSHKLVVITCRTELFTCTTEAGSRSAATIDPSAHPWSLHALLGVAGRVSLRAGHPARDSSSVCSSCGQGPPGGRPGTMPLLSGRAFHKVAGGPRQLLISARRLGAGTQPSRLSGAPNDSRRNPKRCVHQRSRDRPPAAEALR